MKKIMKIETKARVNEMECALKLNDLVKNIHFRIVIVQRSRIAIVYYIE